MESSRLGNALFVVYLLFYVGFVGLSAFIPQVMEWRPWNGLNLAVLYGFGLILLAFFMAALYGYLRERKGSSNTP